MRSDRSRSSGFTLVETLLAMTLALAAGLALYELLLAGRRSFTLQSDLAQTQSTGRALLEILASDLRQAGYAPFGVRPEAIPSGSATRVRRLADLNGNGTVSASTDPGEDVTYVFQDPDGDGRYDVLRGVDRDGDLDFTDTGDSVETIASDVVPIDTTGDAIPEPFLAYDRPPPATRQVSVAFGMRMPSRSVSTARGKVLDFRATLLLRNLP